MNVPNTTLQYFNVAEHEEVKKEKGKQMLKATKELQLSNKDLPS